ncbi:MAG: maleylacetoacetate isomerase [Rudaea sp.]
MTTKTLKLYSYWRSSAAYRARIAINLKGLTCQIVPVSLVDEGGQQHSASYHEVNPQELVPTLIDGERVIRQSLAIIEYLDEMYPQGTALLPAEPRSRARVRALALAVACDIHPLNNTRVLKFLEHEMGVAQAGRERWIRHWIALGLAALEELIADDVVAGEFCHGDAPTMADATLIPQLYNARRWGLDLAAYPTLARIESACLALDAFERARPERQADAPVT